MDEGDLLTSAGSAASIGLWVARERVRLAQRLLETTDLPVEVIARDCGLGSAANLRKQFGRTLATSPRAYRRTFAASSE